MLYFLYFSRVDYFRRNFYHYITNGRIVAPTPKELMYLQDTDTELLSAEEDEPCILKRLIPLLPTPANASPRKKQSPTMPERIGG